MMFILDTNVLAAMMRAEGVPEVAAWMDAQDEQHLFTTTVSQAEIFTGLTIMAEGRRRHGLEKAARKMFDDFEGRLLSFDSGAAMAYAELFAIRRRAGRPASPHDLMVAAIASAQGADVVTRDVSGFEGCGITIINPWKA